jgi:spore germination cell wall hydrolase CwlJ-like protein
VRVGDIAPQVNTLTKHQTFGEESVTRAICSPFCYSAGRQIFTRFRLTGSAGRGLRDRMCEAITSDVGATLILFAASIFVFILFVASYSQRGTWLALCSMSTTMVLGCLFISTVHDHSQVHMRFAWVASELPQLPDWQFAGDVASAFEHLAIFRRCKIGQQGCNAAASAASLRMKDVVKQPAAAETKPAWRLTDDDRDYLIRTIAFEASGESATAKIAVAYVILNRKKSGRWGDNIKAVVTQPGQFEPWETKRTEIEGLSPDDPRYKSAAVVADAVLSGQTPDPTAGATHFLNPTIVRERRGGELPSWAHGEGLPIGNHTFYLPEEGDTSPRQAEMTIVDPRFMPTTRGDH